MKPGLSVCLSVLFMSVKCVTVTDTGCCLSDVKDREGEKGRKRLCVCVFNERLPLSRTSNEPKLDSPS